VLFIVKGKQVECSRHLWEAMTGPKPDPELFTESDGCSKSPDYWKTIGGKLFKLWPACVIHDYHYRRGVLGGTWSSRMLADAILRRNIRQLVLLQGGTHTQAARIAWMYWATVRVASARSFCFGAGDVPLGWWARVREVAGLFTDAPGAHRPL
jgi:hypothetical protein